MINNMQPRNQVFVVSSPLCSLQVSRPLWRRVREDQIVEPGARPAHVTLCRADAPALQTKKCITLHFCHVLRLLKSGLHRSLLSAWSVNKRTDFAMIFSHARMTFA